MDSIFGNRGREERKTNTDYNCLLILLRLPLMWLWGECLDRAVRAIR